MSSFPCLVCSSSGSGQVRYRLGERLVDRYLELVAGRVPGTPSLAQWRRSVRRTPLVQRWRGRARPGIPELATTKSLTTTVV